MESVLTSASNHGSKIRLDCSTLRAKTCKNILWKSTQLVSNDLTFLGRLVREEKIVNEQRKKLEVNLKAIVDDFQSPDIPPV